MMALPRFSVRSLALKWNVFCVLGSVLPFEEYFPLYMQQLGLTPSQIGMTWLFGLPSLSIILTSYIGDRFRSRKLLLILSDVLLVLLSLAPLLPLLVGSLRVCSPDTRHRNDTAVTENATFPRKAQAPDFNNDSLIVNFGNEMVQLERRRGETGTNISKNAFALFLFAMFVKVAYEMVKRLLITLTDVAIMTYLKNDKSNVGWYYVWGHVSSGLVFLLIGVLAFLFEIRICGKLFPAYFFVFPVVATIMALSLAASPWMEYEYLGRRVINWADVRVVLCDPHYVVMLLIALYSGWCVSFQYSWYFWFIDYLGGGPKVLAYGGTLRRFFYMMWYVVSPKFVQKLGDLRCVAFALLLFAIKDCALSFVRNPWLTLPADVLQTGAYVLGKAPLMIHFSKPGTKASSAVIMGMMELTFSIGQGFGGNGFGVLFSAIGPRMALRSNAAFCGIVFTLFVVYIYCRKDIESYEKVSMTSDSESEIDQEKDS